MSDDVEELGPIDYLVVQHPLDRATGEGFAILLRLVDQGIIRVLDLVFCRRAADGTVSRISLDEMARLGYPDMGEFVGASSGLVDDEDVQEAGALLDAGSVASILVYENRWAAHYSATLRRNGAQLISFGRIPVEAIVAALDAADATT